MWQLTANFTKVKKLLNTINFYILTKLGSFVIKAVKMTGELPLIENGIEEIIAINLCGDAKPVCILEQKILPNLIYKMQVVD